MSARSPRIFRCCAPSRLRILCARTGKDGAQAHPAGRRREEGDRGRGDRRDALYRPLGEDGRHLRGARLPLHRAGRRPQLRRRSSTRSRPPRTSIVRCCFTCARSKARATNRPSATRARFTASARMRSSPATAARKHRRRAAEVPRCLRRRDDRGCGEGSAGRRHHRGDARRYRSGEVRQTLSGALLRRRHRGGARGLFCGGPGVERPAAGLCDLLDLLAAGLRSDRPRRRRAESAGRLLHGPRRASSATTARRIWASTTSPTCARCRTSR